MTSDTPDTEKSYGNRCLPYWKKIRDADCRCLLHRLGMFDALPDHVCQSTMQASCRQWLDNHTYGMLGWRPDWRGGVSFPIGEGVYSLVFRSYSGKQEPEWPPLLNDTQRQVHLIISQWAEVELEPNDTKTVIESLEWEWMKSELRDYAKDIEIQREQWPEQRCAYEDALTELSPEEQSLIGNPAVYLNSLEPRLTLFGLHGKAERMLVRYGLPCSPGMRQLLVQETFPQWDWPQKEIDPKMGAVVTSFLTEPCSSGQREGKAYGFANWIFTITGSSVSLPYPLLEKVRDIAQQHQRWWQALRPGDMRPFPTVGRPPREEKDEILALFAEYERDKNRNRFWERARDLECKRLGVTSLTDEEKDSHENRIRQMLRRNGKFFKKKF